jgi:hypothetical protein
VEPRKKNNPNETQRERDREREGGKILHRNTVALGGGLRHIPAVAFGGFRQLNGCLFPLILYFLNFLRQTQWGWWGARKKTKKLFICPLVLFFDIKSCVFMSNILVCD